MRLIKMNRMGTEYVPLGLLFLQDSPDGLSNSGYPSGQQAYMEVGRD